MEQGRLCHTVPEKKFGSHQAHITVLGSANILNVVVLSAWIVVSIVTTLLLLLWRIWRAAWLYDKGVWIWDVQGLRCS